jgi:peptide deformylase
MALMKLTEYPAKVLNEVGDPVEVFDAELARLCDDMFETMYAEEGVGLAAPQVGLSLRLFVMDCAGIKLVAANPQIVAAEGEQAGAEGCLSVAKIHSPLKRAERATLRAQDASGEWYERAAEGLAARCFQHETDHCDGILFINRLTPLKRNMVVKRFQKLKSWR